MKIIDVTLPIFHGMSVYKNKPEKQPEYQTVTNGHVTESRLSLDLHTGTHIDAPLHMINDGDTIETIPPEDLIREVKVFDLSGVEDGIREEDLTHLEIGKNDFVLFKTKNSFSTEFDFNFIFLKESGAKWLVDRGISGVGIDSLGIERSQEGHPTHRHLFSNNVIIIEGLKLDKVEPGTYKMVAAPLKLRGVDAAPARIFLFSE
jgi:arylformamidase